MKTINFILFLTLTLFFIVQHILILKWDFVVYVLNAKFLFDNGFYFEILRPPLISLLIFLFNFGLNWRFGEFMFIIFSTYLFVYSAEKLSERYKINSTAFIIAFITPYFLLYSLLTGSELLSLSLLMLFIYYLKNPKKSGLIGGLLFLTRYNNILYLLFTLLTKDIKKIIKTILIFSLTITPWLIFNYLLTGNFVYSMYDSYYHNIICKSTIFQNFNFIDLIIVINILIPFFITGFLKRDKHKLIMDLIILITLFSFVKIPHKQIRYLFLLTLPIAYYSSFYISKLKKSMFLILILSLTLTFFVSEYNNIITKEDVHTIINTTKNCTVFSNGWVFLNYYGIKSIPLPRYNNINKYNISYFVILNDIPIPYNIYGKFNITSNRFKIIYNTTKCNNNFKNFILKTQEFLKGC